MVRGSWPRALRALEAVDLAIGPGEFVCVVGPSGCGKTTLLNILGRLEQPSLVDRLSRTRSRGTGARPRPPR